MEKWLGRCGRKFPWYPELAEDSPLNNEVDVKRYYLMWTGSNLYCVERTGISVLESYQAFEVNRNMDNHEWTEIIPEKWAIDLWNEYTTPIKG